MYPKLKTPDLLPPTDHSLPNRMTGRSLFSPEPSVLVDHLTRATIVAGVAEAGVDLVLAVDAMVLVWTGTLVALEAQVSALTPVLTGVGVADVTLGQNICVCLLYRQHKIKGVNLITKIFMHLKVPPQ